MNKDKTNNIRLLGTLYNSDESGIIANASQIYDGVAQKSVEERITDLDNKIGSGSGSVINKADNEDLEQTKDSDGNDVLRFKDNEYVPTAFSGLGRKYLRKNVIDINAVTSLEDATSSATVNTSKYVNLRAGVNGTAVIVNNNNTRYLSVNCKAGDSFVIRGFFNKSIGTYFWGFVDSSNKILNCGNIGDDNRKYLTAKVTADTDCTLVINVYYDYTNKEYSVQKITKDSTVSKVNILSNTEISEENTIYIIRNDYNLNQEVIELPKNSTLFFVGGSFKNGTLKGNFSSICTRSNTNILNDVHIEGTWTTTDWYAEWFNAAGDGVTDDTNALHRLLEISMSVTNVRIRCILSRHYFVTSGLLMYPNSLIDGANSGVITAKFSNPLDWVIQNYIPRTSDGKQPSYKEIIDWKAFDGSQYRQWLLSDQTIIKDIRIEGKLTDDNKPIFGGVKLMGCYINTDNVYIANVGTGLFRSSCIKTLDSNDCIFGIYYGYAAECVNGISFRDSYCNANRKSNVVYTSDYKWSDGMASYKKGVAEVTEDDGTVINPEIAVAFISWCYKVLMENIVTDQTGCAVAVLEGGSNITDINHWLEGAKYSYYSFYTASLVCIHPIFMANPLYAFDAINSNVWLCGCGGFGKDTDHNKIETGNYGNFYLLGFTGFCPNNNKIHVINDIKTIELLGNNSNYKTSGKLQKYTSDFISSSSFGDTVCSYIPYNTTIEFDGKWKNALGNIVFTGYNRTSSILDMSNMIQTYYNYVSMKFSTLTILNFTLPYWNHNRVNLEFYNCDIKGVYFLSAPFNSYNRIELADCTIYNKGVNSKNASMFDNNQAIIRDIIINNCKVTPNIRLGIGEGQNNLLHIPHKGNTSLIKNVCWDLQEGFDYYNTDHKRHEYWDGQTWVDYNGNAFYTTAGTTDEYPTNVNIKIGSIFHDTTLNKDVSLTRQGAASYFKVTFNEKVTDGKLMSNSDVAIKVGKIHIAFSGIEMDLNLTNQDILYALYDANTVNKTLSNWLAKLWVNSGYYAYTENGTAFLSDMKCGSAEIGTCADVSGSETNLSFTLAVQKGTANVWDLDENISSEGLKVEVNDDTLQFT